MPTSVLLDGTLLQCRAPGLDGAIAAGRAAAGSRLIVEVRADGVVIDTDLPGQALASLDGVERIEMLTADPLSLARCTIHDAADALEEIATVQSDAAGLLQTGDTDRAMALLRRALEVWGGAAQTVDLVNQMHLVGDGAPSTVVAGQAHPRLNGMLGTVRDALAAQDYAALADILAYDLRDLAQEWTRDLRLLAERLGADGARTGSQA